MGDVTPKSRPASSVKAKLFRGIIHSLATVLGMSLSGWLARKPEYGAVAPLILGPFGGWLRDKFPGYASTIPF